MVAVALLLAACGGQDEGTPPAPATGEPAVVVSTVEPSTMVLTEVPTPTLAPTPTPTPPAPLAALVNGQYVFLADYERRVAQYEEALLAQGIDPATPEGQASLAQARQEVLDGLIDSVLIEQGAGLLGITLSDIELESQVEADIAAGGGQAAFDEWLQATGQSRDDYKQMLRQSLISQRVMEAVSADVPTEAEQVHARHIVADSEEAARDLLAQLQQGADFVALAREHSLDLATRDNGGDLGWFARGVVAPELENAAFALQPGQISDVVHLGGGYHLIQVVEREANRPLSPEMQIELKLAAFEQWLAGLRALATVERFVGE
jgi:parvulin-like peptidyl-prolyl isomerase